MHNDKIAILLFCDILHDYVLNVCTSYVVYSIVIKKIIVYKKDYMQNNRLFYSAHTFYIYNLIPLLLDNTSFKFSVVRT